MSKFSEIEPLRVAAPSFDDPTISIELRIDDRFVQTNHAAGRRQILLDFWPLVFGGPPPIGNIGHHENGVIPQFDGLLSAHALYSGLERPIINCDNGDEIYVYLTKPVQHYRLIPSMVCVAKLEKTPENTIFACYVRRDNAEADEILSGTILSWERVVADLDDPDLPEGHEVRYKHEVWRR